MLIGLFVGSQQLLHSLIFSPSFKNLEQQESRRNIKRCVQCIEREIWHLDEYFGSDWAAWDDTYEFVEDRNEDYIESNLVDTSFTDNDINLIYILNATHEVVWGKVMDLATEREITLPEFHKGTWRHDHPLLAPRSPGEYVAGVMIGQATPLLISSRPILSSHMQGPSRGTFIMARFLDANLIQTLSKQVDFDFEVQVLGAMRLDAESQAALYQILAGEEFCVSIIDDVRLNAYALLRDIQDQPALLIRAELPRDISMTGLRAMRSAHGSIAVLGLLQLLAALLLIERTVLARLTNLERFVRQVGITADASSRLSKMGGDELGQLAHNINAMLESLEKAQAELRDTEAQLRQSQEVLEQRVREKTSELEKQLTERSRIEAEAVVTAHLASLGELAAGVAHEINNPINGIINYAQLLKDGVVAHGDPNRLTDGILKEGERIARIVKNLLAFARQDSDFEGRVMIPQVLEDALSLMERQIRRDGVDIRIHLAADLPEVRGHPHQIQQVFINLMSNARYALNKRFPDEHAEKILEISGKQLEKDGNRIVRIVFRDNGTGIPKNMLSHLCEPFFSTKPKGEGTGLGLSISHRIMTDHGGRLAFESVEGSYTKVILDFPVC